MINAAGAPLAQSVSQAGSNNTGDTGQAKGGSGGGSGSPAGKGSGSGKGGAPQKGQNPQGKGDGSKTPGDPENSSLDHAGKVASGSSDGIEKSQAPLNELAENQKALEGERGAAAADVAAKEEALRGAQDNLSKSQELAKEADLEQRAAVTGVEKPSEMADAIRKTEDSLAAERGVVRAQDQLAEASKQLGRSEDALRSATAASDALGSSAKTLDYASDLKGVGKRVLGPAGHAIDVYQLNAASNTAYELCQSGQKDAGGKALLVQAGDTIGSNGGAALGGFGGAALGTAAGLGVGRVPGAVTGGIGGGIAGAYGGSEVGKGAGGLVSDYVPGANKVACDVAVGWHDTKEFAAETSKAAGKAAGEALDSVKNWLSSN